MGDPRVTAGLDAARDTAQQLVTACLHHDRGTAVTLARSYMAEAIEPLALPLVLADLVAYVHCRWARVLSEVAGNPATDEDMAEGWAALMADIEQWRSEVQP